jgi:glycerate 2-kinase
VHGLDKSDLVLCLLSGGGSALTPLPVRPLTLAEKQAITRTLLKSGATISEINCVRRHLSRFKGGHLAAAAHPAQLVTLAISDVPGDAPIDIASGPTVGDPTTCADALAVLDRHRIAVPGPVRAGLEDALFESVKPADRRLEGSSFTIIASARTALDAAASLARAHALEVRELSDRLEGEARKVGRALAEAAREVERDAAARDHPVLLLSGGETTVTVRGPGRGGRNVECLLGFGIAVGASDRIHALMADTDGVDGTEPVAGACWRPDTPARASKLGLDAHEYLARNDAHSFFELLGDSIVTGPTRTNVNDFRAILVAPAEPGPEGPVPGN